MSSLTRGPRVLTQDQMITWAAVVLGGLCGLVYAVLWAGNALAGLPTEGLVSRALAGDLAWTTEHTRVVTAAVAAVAVLVPAWWVVDVRLFGPRRPVTRAEKYLCTRWQARKLTQWYRGREIRKHGGKYELMFLGYLGRTRRRLYLGPEDSMLGITGPRFNKSSSIANPAVATAPGAVLATSNKPDVVADTIAYRPGPVYIFDPQDIYHGPNPSPMYWNPLTYITDAPTERMSERAAVLARRFLFAAGGASKSDPHWGNAAASIMGAMMLAAAVDHRPVTDVYTWVMAPNDITPTAILERDGRFPLVARTLDEYAHHPDRQRAGEYGAAQTALAFLSYDTVVPWVTPGRGRTEFRPESMVAGGSPTLYVLSRDGDASAGALTAALTIAVAEAAEREGNRNGGRLDVPMMLVLDEVANVCKWEALPDQYSHYGSKGIILVSLLQSYSQGKEVWGEDRMKQLLSLPSVFITGGGVKDNGFHESVSNMVSTYSKVNISQSSNKGGRSTETSFSEDTILSVGDLRQLPREYSLMFVAGTPTILLRHVPMWRRRLKKAPVMHTAPAPVEATGSLRDYRAARTGPSGWATALTVEED